jgi:hypothetical protein
LSNATPLFAHRGITRLTAFYFRHHAACSQRPIDSARPVLGEAAASLVGQSATADIVEADRQAALTAEVRVIANDGGATRDFKPSRLNVMLDEAVPIAKLGAGSRYNAYGRVLPDRIEVCMR